VHLFVKRILKLMNSPIYILVSDCWFLNEEFVLLNSLLSLELTDSVSVPGKCLIIGENFDTKTTWDGSSLRYSVVVRNIIYLLGPFGFKYTSQKEILRININKKIELFLSFKTTWLISCGGPTLEYYTVAYHPHDAGN
jgi:hypothetical protein